MDRFPENKVSYSIHPDTQIFLGRKKGKPNPSLNPPAPESLCDWAPDLFDCGDFAIQFEAQQCFDSCWVVRGYDVHGSDTDWDSVACKHSPSDGVPMDRNVACGSSKE